MTRLAPTRRPEPEDAPVRTLVAFAPFSDVRPYDMSGEAPPETPRDLPWSREADAAGAAPPPPVPGLDIARMNLHTPHTARILECRRAAVHSGCDSLAVAFSKSVDSARSPRIAVLSPRRPMPAQLPRNLAQLPLSARPNGGSGSGSARKSPPDSELIKPPTYLKNLKLFDGDQSWLFYPTVDREQAEFACRRSVMITAVPDEKYELPTAHDPIRAARRHPGREIPASYSGMSSRALLACSPRVDRGSEMVSVSQR